MPSTAAARRKPTVTVVETAPPPAPIGHNGPPDELAQWLALTRRLPDILGAPGTRSLDAWYELQGVLSIVVNAEKVMRADEFKRAFPAPVVGTNRSALGHGKDLVGTHKMNYAVDREALQAHGGAVPAELLHRVVKYKPEVSVGEWNKLTDEERKHFGPFVTERPGTPTLEIKNAKR